MQATDPDLGDGQELVYLIISEGVPYVVDENTGIVTTAGVFRGLSGTQHEVEVEARDNKGVDPFFSASGTITVSHCHSLQSKLSYLSVTLPNYVHQL